MASRKTSLTLIDLEEFKETDRRQDAAAIAYSEKYHEHSEIFDEICQEAEAEDQLDQRPRGQIRRVSLTGSSGSSSMEWDKPVEIAKLHRRRHSTFNPRNRAAHRKEHAELDDHLKMLEDKQSFRRASVVHNLLEFSVNFDVSTATMSHEMSPALNFSCPVLSYMNDDEEDSVELRLLRRPSLVSIPDDSNAQSWESFKDDGVTQLIQDGEDMSREYIFELPPMEEVVKPRGKRRRPHSYKLLEKRLASESQCDVIKSLTLMDMAAPAINVAAMPAASSQIHPKALDLQAHPKALDLDVANTFQSKREQPVSLRQQCARGA